MAKIKITDYIASAMKELEGPDGYELSRCEFVKEADTWYLRVFADKLSGGEYVSMSSDDCEIISRFLSSKLDADDPIEQNYYLEVSSPGLDRLLVSQKDFDRFAGNMIDIKLYKPLNGTKELNAKLIALKDNVLYIEMNNEKVMLPYTDAAKINLSVIF